MSTVAIPSYPRPALTLPSGWLATFPTALRLASPAMTSIKGNGIFQSGYHTPASNRSVPLANSYWTTQPERSAVIRQLTN